MKTIHSLFTVILLLSITGCKKSEWFDVKSNVNLTVPSTLKDFEYLLDSYVTMNQSTPGLAEVGSDGHYMTEFRWSDYLNDPERNAYVWTNNLPYTKVDDWKKSYEKIFRCNLVLDGLKKLNPNDETEKYNRIKGNALFHRAKNYYDLAQIYAQPYQASSAASDLGIPLKEGIDVTDPAKQATVKATYDQILADLKTASGILPVLPTVVTRGSKTGAFALLARTYLTMSDYVNAGLYADSALKLYDKLIDFNKVNPNAESMGLFNTETIFHAERTTLWYSTWLSGEYSVDPSLYALYENDDLRKSRFFTVFGTDISFKGNYCNESGVGFNGLAVDEVYLIRAECYARSGNVTTAMKDLNDLLKTRWNNAVTYPMRTATNSEDALRQVLLERGKELLFRNLRWTDLRRLNLDPRFKTTLSRTIGGKTYTLEPGSYKYTLPIPQDVLNLAPLLKQAPGW